MIRRGKLLVLGTGILALGLFGFAYRRPLSYFVLFHLGRSPEACAWTDMTLALQRDWTQVDEAQATLTASAHQVHSDPEGYELWRTAHGDVWVPSGNGEALPRLLTNMERRIDQPVPCVVRPGDIVLDGGAHVGLFTREALASGAALVVAIEPAAENLECLTRNLAEEIQNGRVIVYPQGLWDEVGNVSFVRQPTASHGGRVAVEQTDEAGTDSIPVTTIDRLVSELNLERVDFIKLHVEGSEIPAIKGAQRTITEFRPTMVIAAHHRVDDAERIPEIVDGVWNGYETTCGGCYVDRLRLLIRTERLCFAQ